MSDRGRGTTACDFGRSWDCLCNGYLSFRVSRWAISKSTSKCCRRSRELIGGSTTVLWIRQGLLSVFGQHIWHVASPTFAGCRPMSLQLQSISFARSYFVTGIVPQLESSHPDVVDEMLASSTQIFPIGRLQGLVLGSIIEFFDVQYLILQLFLRSFWWKQSPNRKNRKSFWNSEIFNFFLYFIKILSSKTSEFSQAFPDLFMFCSILKPRDNENPKKLDKNPKNYEENRENLRRLNKAGQSVNGNFWLSKSIENYRMTSTQLELMNGWLIGNYCPDVF